jgi:hypothetical protein
MDLELLRNYRKQNPEKYKIKFGDKLPEEIELSPNLPPPIGPVKVEITKKEEIEPQFEDKSIDLTADILKKEDMGQPIELEQPKKVKNIKVKRK